MGDVSQIVSSLGSLLVSFGSLGASGWVAAGVFTVVLGIVGFFISRWINQMKIDQANKKTDEERSKASSDVSNEGRTIETDSSKAASEIDSLYKKK